MSESHTRQTLIDGQLKAAGWEVHVRTRASTKLDILVDPNVVLDPAAPLKAHQCPDRALLDRRGAVHALMEARRLPQPYISLSQRALRGELTEVLVSHAVL